jgi:hypothetical protein
VGSITAGFTHACRRTLRRAATQLQAVSGISTMLAVSEVIASDLAPEPNRRPLPTGPCQDVQVPKVF